MMVMPFGVRGCSSKRDALLVLAVFTLCVGLVQNANTQVALCCHLIPQQDVDCMRACRESNEKHIEELCSGYYDSFWECVLLGPDTDPSNNSPNSNNETENGTENGNVSTVVSTPPTKLPDTIVEEGFKCCLEEGNHVCKSACVELLEEHRHLTSDAVLSGLQDPCNQTQPLALHPLVNCLVSTYEEQLKNFPHFPDLDMDTVDFARLSCCFKASSDQCREDCINYHLHPTFDSRAKFNSDCRYQADEIHLFSCFEEVTSPSKPGCSGMHFCKMFNNRPSSMFRHCRISEDRAAEVEYNHWVNSRNFYYAFVGMQIPLTDISQCMSEWWKTLSCLYFIQPTDTLFHTTTLCRKDCLQMMETCMDSESQLSIEDICNKLTPEHTQEHCLSLSAYMSTSDGELVDTPIRQPCNDNTCSQDEVCLVNLECDPTDQNMCKTYSCVKGCRLGLNQGHQAVSVPRYQMQKLTVPLMPYNKTSTLCHSYHRCHQDHLHDSGRLLTEMNFSCSRPSSCVLEGIEYPHDYMFEQDCNVCVCRNGYLLCSNWTCSMHTSAVVTDTCVDRVVSKCTRLGRTVHSRCGYPKVNLMGGVTNGTCPDTRGCWSNSCADESQCVDSLSPCLAAITGTCKQHTCVTAHNSSCSSFAQMHLCDKSNTSYSSVCSFLSSNSQFDYWGLCKKECSSYRPVCGMDGNTYHTPCHAHSIYVPIDYYGRCSKNGCNDVRCPPLQNKGCKSFVPPGSCCPKCGGLVSVLIDTPQLIRDLPNMELQQVTVKDVLSRLEQRMNTLGCRVRGYLHHSGDDVMVVVVLPQEDEVSDQQVQGCRAEAVAMVTRINTKSVYYSMDGLLTHLTGARFSSDVSQESISRGTRMLPWQPSLSIIMLFLIVINNFLE